MNIIFCDVETTGLDRKNDSIIQIAGIIRVDGENVEEFNWNMRPYKSNKIDPDATAKTGLTQEDIEQYPDQAEVFDKFISLLDKHGIGSTWNSKALFCGYNSPFDAEFVRNWFEHNGNTKYGYRFTSPDFDVMRIALLYYAGVRSEFRNFKLSTVYRYTFGESFEDSHNAMADIKATERLFDFLCEKLLLPLMLKSDTEPETKKPVIPMRQIPIRKVS